MHNSKGTQPCTFRQLWDNVSGLVLSDLVWSGLVWPEYYSISAADMFVLVHSNFGDHKNYDDAYYRVLLARPHIEASLRDGLII